MKKAFLYIVGLALLGAMMVVSADASFIIIKEAEEADLLNAVVESRHAGFTGLGYVNFFNQEGSAVQWTVSVPEAGFVALIQPQSKWPHEPCI